MKLYTLSLIIILRLLSALPFAVYYSSLQLYLLSADFHHNLATSLVGNILALSFGASMIGGILAGRYISYRAFFIFSMICQAIGCLTFMTVNHAMILWFSSLFLLGSAGITISLNMMITERYEAHDYAREKVFFWFYMALNIGYLLGYSISGYYGNINAYYYIPFFIFSFAIIATILALLNWYTLEKTTYTNQRNIPQFLFIISSLFLIIRLLLQFSQITNFIIIGCWLIISMFMLFILIKKSLDKKNEILIFYLLLLAALVFWSIYFLAPMALIVFIKHYVNLRTSGILIAPQWIQNINTLVIIIGTIFLGSRTKLTTFNAHTIISQFSMGLCALGLGFGFLVFGIFLTHASEKVMLIWVMVSYILQSLGELLIGPIGYALIGRLIPKAYHSIMMGIWITILGVAGAIASKLSTLAPYTLTHHIGALKNYEHYFLMMSLISIGAAMLVYLFKPKIIKK